MSEIFYGYIMEDDDTHYGYTELDATNYREIAEFIFSGRVKNKKVLITDILDLPVIIAETPGIFVDRINTEKINSNSFVITASEMLKEKGWN